MAKNDVRIVDVAGLSAVPTRLFPVQDYTNSSSTQILAGEPVRISGAEGGNYVLKLATGEPVIGTDILSVSLNLMTLQLQVLMEQ